MLLGRFCPDGKGGVAPLPALSMVPIMGTHRRFDRLQSRRQMHGAMQSALDATGLVLSQTAQDISATELNSKADAYFRAIFNPPEARAVNVNIGMTQPTECT